MSSDNSGPAFPASEASFEHFGNYSGYMGMTLRDYFAAKAMQSIINTLPQVENLEVKDEDDLLRISAEDAYRFADAMLKARQS